jgi:hypothetical protein
MLWAPICPAHDIHSTIASAPTIDFIHLVFMMLPPENLANQRRASTRNSSIRGNPYQDKRLSLIGNFLRLQLGITGPIFVKHLNARKNVAPNSVDEGSSQRSHSTLNDEANVDVCIVFCGVR